MKDLLKFFGWLTVIIIGFIVVGSITGFFGDAASTAKREFQASTMLKRYEWFKDASSQLEKKVADIQVYEHKLKLLKEDYPKVSRSDWPRDDREQYNIWISEMDGIKMSYNSLASQYNAAMVKFNYRFTNVGDMPNGSSNPLPKEYKPYIEQ